MPTSDLAAHFGLFLRRQFIDPEMCARIIAEARCAPTTQAPVYIEGSSERVHETVRKATSMHPSCETISWVHERLFREMPAIAEHFKITLTDCEQPQFLVYRAGDFFVLHQDGASDDNLEFDHLRVRKISIVIFLNDAAMEPADGTFSGGALLFHQEGDAQTEPLTFPLWGETGLLVAFASHTLHEVTPVTNGERFTIINFFR
jgi:predicted 2-oxoglutarate/Fe(II)-dependent dioxygenase YbiX